MSGLHDLIGILTRHRPSAGVRYGIPLLAVGVMTFVRYLAPTYVAPFLLYIPVLLAGSLAYGRGAGALVLAISTLIATWFYTRDGDLGGVDVSLLCQYVAVGGVMVWICDALRRSVARNDATLESLDAANQVLLRNQAELTDANARAQAAKEAAEEHSRAKSRFLANMSHELRTPLSAVIGYSEMLEEEAEELGQDVLLKDLGKIKSNAKHLLGLINDVLDLSKVEAEKMDLYPEDIDVAAFATDAAGTVDALVAKKGNVLTLDIAGDVGQARTDAVKLRQCLFNLLSNAAKFTESGTITLSVIREDGKGADWLRFTVEDTGIGMTPEQVGRLFERFTQADETTTRKFGGTGLGLALSRAFARLLGGDITVASVEGQGTTFTLRIPALAPEHVAGEVPTAAPENLSGTEDLVLVIDDEANQRELMTRFLERQRFAVRTATDGRTGLDLARSLKPRAILLDVMMPDMDGWSVLAALKADAETAGIPVVMVSFVADAALSASLGAVEAVPKPVDWTRLRTILDQFRAADGDVLVVDDDADMRHRLRTVLERDGWSVREAGNGQEALDQVRHGAPRLVLLDLTMPVMDGFSFLDRLRVLPGCAEVPVVVLSARDVTRAERARLAEADRVLRKGDTSLQDIATELRKLDNRQAEAGRTPLVGTAPGTS
ncbi:hybrid sensor histidine kinase/response regulator [Methylobacterium sp. SI9]|uniref:hybrid sensor histidine kinase/response regulator n=1 Tax=Methylobacterium guangdongense TaxID=3138811 RepID=UPI00313CE110